MSNKWGIRDDVPENFHRRNYKVVIGIVVGMVGNAAAIAAGLSGHLYLLTFLLASGSIGYYAGRLHGEIIGGERE